MLFYLQTKSPDFFHSVFLTVYIILFVMASELLSTKAGVFASLLIIILETILGISLLNEDFETYFLVAILTAFASLMYFIIKIFRKRKLEQIQKREKHFLGLVNFSLQPIILKDKNGKILFASNSIKDMLKLKEDFPVGSLIDGYIHPEDLESHKNFLNDVVNHPNSRRTIEVRLKTGDGKYIWTRNDSINLLSKNNIKAIVSSFQDITEAKKSFENEKKARALAEKAVIERDEFLSIASHELKTPLTTVILQLQSTLRRISTQSLADFSGEALLNSLQIAEKQTQSLTLLINDLLNVSLTSSGKLTLAKERVNLTKLTRNLIARFEEEIALAGCSIITKTSDNNIVGFWDPVRIEQAISNLLTNALKYSPGKTITIKISKQNSFANVSVTDRGTGIEAIYLKEIFEPFKRADSTGTKKGLGVGLYIAKQIASAHGGNILVTSKIKRGSTFTLQLPLLENKS